MINYYLKLVNFTNVAYYNMKFERIPDWIILVLFPSEKFMQLIWRYP
jgi:hypothetical protein